MRVHGSFRRFLRDERGSALVEFMLLLPLLVWVMVALVAFWDVFRTINTAQKAAYSVSDLISRQEDNLSASFVDGMQDVLDYLMVGAAQDTRMRITSLYYDDASKSYKLIFSVSPGDRMLPYTETQLQTLTDRIPILNDKDSVVIVETMVDYTPPFNTGIFNIADALGSNVFDEFVVTPPRFRTAICLDSLGCPVGI
jgi:Flp pilus assembly pilin Flp